MILEAHRVRSDSSHTAIHEEHHWLLAVVDRNRISRAAAASWELADGLTCLLTTA